MLLKNRIFLDRARERRRDQRRRTRSRLGWTGPCLRSTGVAYDIRKAHPYLKYDEVDFDVPVGTQRRHARPLPRAPRRDPPEQAHHRAVRSSGCPTRGPSTATTRASCCPPKTTSTRRSRPRSSTSSSIMEGAKVPAGEVLLVHRGRQRRARLLPRLRRHAARPTACASGRRASRSPAACTQLIEGRMLSDIVPTFGSLNMIGGECDH